MTTQTLRATLISSGEHVYALRRLGNLRIARRSTSRLSKRRARPATANVTRTQCSVPTLMRS